MNTVPITTRMILLSARIGCAFVLLLAACGQPTAPNSADPHNPLIIGGSPLFVAPSDLTLTVEADTQIVLKWKDNSQVERGHVIERRTGVGMFVRIADVGENTDRFVDHSGWRQNALCTYRVKAYTDFRESGYSNQAWANQDLGRPSALIATVVSDASLSLQWTYSGNSIARFEILWGTDSSDFRNVLSAAPSARTITLPGPLDRNARRYVAVRTNRTPFNVSGYSNILTVEYARRLMVGGTFTEAGGRPAASIAAWDGSGWSGLGSGINGTVNCVTMFATSLYAGGLFSNAGGSAASNIARWDGRKWEPLGPGVNGEVRSFGVFQNGLHIGGIFTSFGGMEGAYLAQWLGNQWTGPMTRVNGLVRTFAVYGIDFHAGGAFTPPVIRLTGSSSRSIGTGLDATVNALAVFQGELYAGGDFSTTATGRASRIARWDGTRWAAVGSGVDGSVYALGVYKNELYVGGKFVTAGGLPARRIARWDGTTWKTVGPGVGYIVYALATYGDELYVGGVFISAGGVAADRIARWNGSSWSSAGGGVNGAVYSLANYAMWTAY